ncbi:PREDICTED: ubiquitin carboxyl-terminal hydrolase 17-like protein 6 [Chinchilla lanigera]|uniref:ubiquitin carboxyl-terminal hydrolase 17-like protein 6 n=1 Tax=Chinchilla lanigera TaxID=34839 RepID=UPI000697850E|nr:PREDICTED: ubiquitin carboxyl-terminal hydrolase 17-like protein 6 [Chinchilla lanigera]
MEALSANGGESFLSTWTDPGQRVECSPVATELDQRDNVSPSWKTPFGVGAGLWNMGNTCYVNAALQCLTYTPPLANYMLARQHKPTCSGLRTCMMCVMQRHVTRALRRPGRVIQPLHALLADFHREKQEDAHEFLMFMVEAMQKVDLHSEDRDLIQHIFGGYWRSQIKCLHCGSTSDTFDPYLDIPLDIQAAESVEQALTQCAEPEELSGENAYHCGVCLQKVPASKTLSLHTCPKVLIFLLKRFSDFTGEKIAKHVQYSEWLDMQPYMSEHNTGPVLYTLYAVLVHAGHTCHSGHYFSYVKAPDGCWYQMNDNKVTACDRSSVIAQDAYVLFYVQKPNLERDNSGMSLDMEERALGSADKDMSVKIRDLQVDSYREHIKLEKQTHKTQVKQSTLDEWKFLQEQNQPKTELNLRKVDCNLPANAVLMHQSKYTVELRKTHPEEENTCPTNSARNISGQESTKMNEAPCLGGSARATKKKKKKNRKNNQGKRTVLVI